jgi:hypothetical protein
MYPTIGRNNRVLPILGSLSVRVDIRKEESDKHFLKK